MKNGSHETGGSTSDTSAPSFSHLSLEPMHFYSEDFQIGYQHLVRCFRRAAPWANTWLKTGRQQSKKFTANICLMLDDYGSQKRKKMPPPSEAVEMAVGAAREAEIKIQYVGREGGLAQEVDGPSLAKVVLDRLVDPPGLPASRPPVQVSGWISNGRYPHNWNDWNRSPMEAMHPSHAEDSPRLRLNWGVYVPYIDVELFSESKGVINWSCAYLAATWALLRLGALDTVCTPMTPQDFLGKSWDELPIVSQLEPDAPPLRAYTIANILDIQFMLTERAGVDTVLGAYANPAACEQEIKAFCSAESLNYTPVLAGRAQGFLHDFGVARHG